MNGAVNAAGVVVVIMGVAFSGGPGAWCETTPAAKGYPTVDEIIAANTDILGEASLCQADGPGYEFFAGAMPPLRYVNAAFRHYPIVLAAPRNRCKARLVSNGSALNAKGGGNAWTDAGVPVWFRAGPAGALFGEDLARLDGPRLADGYLPIIEMRYREGDATYRQEAFVSVEPAFADHAVVFVRFTLDAGETGTVSAHIEPPGTLLLEGRQLRNDRGQVLVWMSANWRWDSEKQVLTAAISPGAEAVLAVFTEAAPKLPMDAVFSESVFQEQRQSCAAAWRELLDRGVKLDVPESVVSTAWRAVLAANFAVVSGSKVNYSAGNQYECEYITEGSRTVGAFLLFGYPEESRSMLLSLLGHSIPEHKYAVTGWKLRALAQFYWLTRDDGFMQENRSAWEPLIPLLINDLDSATGLTPKDFYASDIAMPVWNLKTNATCWRGLRDVAAVLREMGEPNPALEDRVERYRQAILGAVDKSVRRDIDPPFIPNILLDGQEEPYPALTATTTGSYWCLVSNAVLDSGVFDAQPEKNAWMLNTLHQRGGVCMGMLRFDQHSRLFANERGLDDNYTLGYTLHLLKNGDADRALVSFYGKLAQGFTRDTFVGGEGTGLDPLDQYGRPMYLPPCTAGNAFFLWTLRHLLVQDWDTNDDGRPDTLRLLHAVPRRWLRDGAIIKIEEAPTAFGKLSLQAESHLTDGKVLVWLVLPPHPPEKIHLQARVPEGWNAVSATVDGTPCEVKPNSVVDLSACTGTVTVQFLLCKTDGPLPLLEK
ncbi:MAG TPA: hypothetical protein PKO23_07130 [Candidatus Hydrogenedentes bacterium]|nr:hypothetical protein [Candidatus Hydrogenedentota bacterium]